MSEPIAAIEDRRFSNPEITREHFAKAGTSEAFLARLATPRRAPWHAQPFRQSLSIDKDSAMHTYGRACQASSEYVLVRVPFDPITGTLSLHGLTGPEIAFVTENVTPLEAVA